MTVHPPYMQRQAEKNRAYRNKVIADRVSVCISVATLVGIIWTMLIFFADAVVQTAENEEKYNKKTWTVEQTYSKPAAFRLASPTETQMDHLHDLLRVAEVNR